MDNITTSFNKIKKLYKTSKDLQLKEIKFEFVMSLLFPEIYDNIKEEMRRQYTLGYAEGLKSVKEPAE